MAMEKEIEALKNMFLSVGLPLLLLADFCGFVNLMCQPNFAASIMKFIIPVTYIIVALTILVIPAMNWYLDRHEQKKEQKDVRQTTGNGSD
jgi:hypothetical protein